MEEYWDVYNHFMLYYGRDIQAMKDAEKKKRLASVCQYFYLYLFICRSRLKSVSGCFFSLAEVRYTLCDPLHMSSRCAMCWPVRSFAGL